MAACAFGEEGVVSATAVFEQPGTAMEEEAEALQRGDLPPMAVPVRMDVLLAQNPRLALSDVRHLQQWLAKQPHLPPLYGEELVPFLVSNAFSLERTKRCVDLFFTMRSQAPQLFRGRDPALPENQAQLQAFRVARLPHRASGGRRLVVMGYAAPAPAAPFDGPRSLALSTALMEMVALADAGDAGAGADGLVLLLDAGHVTLAHLTAMPVAALQALFAFLQEAAPIRVDAVHVVRLGPVGRRAVALVKPFVGGHLQSVMHLHSHDMTELHKEFPPEILPQELGGTCGTIAAYHQELVQELVRRRDWVLAQEGRCVDESLRPPAPGGTAPSAAQQQQHHFGPQGSFRRLQVD